MANLNFGDAWHQLNKCLDLLQISTTSLLFIPVGKN